MIYVLVGIASLGPMIGVLMAWVLVRHALGTFEGQVSEAIGRAVSLQDDRIRKGREREGSRTPTGQGQVRTEERQLAQMMAGQPVEHDTSRWQS